jgi:RNA polymerase sigma-70 factor (ECF subfamily)
MSEPPSRTGPTAATPFPGTAAIETHTATDLVQIREALVRAVRSVCPPSLADRRDDLVQVALMRVAELQRKSETERQLSSFYLRRVAHSALVDEIRRLRRRGEVPIEDDEGEERPIVSETANPEDRAHGREIATGIRDCLTRLVPPRRRAVVLHLQGHNVPETADLLGWNEKRARNLVYRGLADLRRCLEAKGLRPGESPS